MSRFSDLFHRSPKVGAPVATPTVANINYPYAPIVIQPPQMAGPGGDPSQTIYRMLEEIRSFPVGAQFFMALSAADKQIGVRYAGPANNQAAGGVRGYVLLRQKHDAQNAVGFGLELQHTLNNLQVATGNGIPWVAQQLYQQQVTTWTNGQIRPFSNPPRPVAAPHGGAGPKPLPQTPPQIIADMINTYLAGTALPSRNEADAIMLVLEDYLNPGAGVATRIYFDPHKEVVNGMARPPHCGLFHELTHAYYNALGRQLGREDSLDEGNGGRLFELMAVGLGPFATRPFSENAFRTALGVPLRLSYP